MLRRMSVFAPSSTGSARQIGEGIVVDRDEDDMNIGEHEGLVATLRHVLVPTPNPLDAPSHPADTVELSTRSSTTSTSLSKDSAESQKKTFSKDDDQPGARLIDYINTLEISRPEISGSKEAVVVLHGYAAALGYVLIIASRSELMFVLSFFFHNWESISATSASTGRRTYFLDLLGMGLSSRPSPVLLASPSGTPIASRVARAEHFFVDSLESWRISVGVRRMILIGHSLGGYLSAAYTVRYPNRVSGLILLSPAGVPRGPGYDKSATEGRKNEGDLEEATNAAELELKGDKTDDQQSLLRRSAMKGERDVIGAPA